MNLTIREIAEITGGKILCGDEETRLRHLSFDSRDIPEDCLFIPTIGARVDGHDFIAGAFEKGALAALTARGDIIRPDRAHILVKDTQKALEALGRYHRSLFKGTVTGITGSVGKTTTRELTKAALSAGGTVTGTMKNMNSQIGTPVVLAHMDLNAERAVMEMGISEPGEMRDLIDLVHPTMAVVTNIGVAHIEYLGSREGICEEKMHIADELGPDNWIILNGDEPLLKQAGSRLSCRVLYYGFSPENDLYAVDINETDGISFTAVLKKDGEDALRIPVVLRIPGRHNILNALAALGAAWAEGIDPFAAARAMGEFEGFSRRLERIRLGNLLVIDDSYNASPPSMEAALSVLEKAEGARRIAVLADMLELGEGAERLHREVGSFAANREIDFFLLIGELVSQMEEPLQKAGKNYIRCRDWQEGEEALTGMLKAGDTVLLKGSNGMRLDLLLAALKKNRPEGE